MRAGKLNCRVQVDEPVTVRDASGGSVLNWVTRTTVWGRIEPLRMTESLIASQMLSPATTRIKIRFGPIVKDMTSKWRLRHGTKIYDIISIINTEERDEELVMLCKSGTNKG